MRKVYLFVYADELGDRNLIKSHLNSMPEVLAWRHDLPNCFYVVSEKSADDFVVAYKAKNPANARFIFVEITGNHQGWLSNATWDLINTTFLNNDQQTN